MNRLNSKLESKACMMTFIDENDKEVTTNGLMHIIEDIDIPSDVSDTRKFVLIEVYDVADINN